MISAGRVELPACIAAERMLAGGCVTGPPSRELLFAGHITLSRIVQLYRRRTKGAVRQRNEPR